MVSAAQIEIYTTHNGDIDLYQRRGSPQMDILGDSWKTIEDLRSARQGDPEGARRAAPSNPAAGITYPVCRCLIISIDIQRRSPNHYIYSL